MTERVNICSLVQQNGKKAKIEVIGPKKAQFLEIFRLIYQKQCFLEFPVILSFMKFCIA